MKWNSYGKYFHLTNLLFYCIFLVFVTVYTSLLMVNVNPSTAALKKLSDSCAVIIEPEENDTDILNSTFAADNATQKISSNFEPGKLPA